MVYVSTDHKDPRSYIMDHMSSFDIPYYIREISEHGVHSVAQDDWDNFWTVGDEVYYEEGQGRLALDFQDVVDYFETLVGLHIEPPW